MNTVAIELKWWDFLVQIKKILTFYSYASTMVFIFGYIKSFNFLNTVYRHVLWDSIFSIKLDNFCKFLSNLKEKTVSLSKMFNEICLVKTILNITLAKLSCR